MNYNLKNTKQIAITSGVFTCLVGLLLLLNYLQLSTRDPLEGKALGTLVERLAAEPDNQQLTAEVRQLDLLARKAYFNSVWQIRTGALFMLIGAIVFVFAMRSYLRLRFRIEEPDASRLDSRKNRLKTERWMVVATVLLLLTGGLSALFSDNQLRQYDGAATANASKDAGIEKLEIAGSDSTALNDSTAVDSVSAEEAIPLDGKTIRQQSNGFRGAFGQGVSAVGNIPTTFAAAAGKNVRWKTKVALPGMSSPVVWGNRVFLTSATANKRVVYCFDLTTGALLWEKAADKIAGSPSGSPQTTDDTGLAAPTCTVDGQRVFALFGNGDLVAFTLAGERVWAKNLGVPDNHYGHASSLITWGGKLFIQYDTHKTCKVLALSTETGKQLWSTPRTSQASWSSPILIQAGGSMQLVLQATPNVAAYNINTGKLLWSVECMSGEVGPSPAFGGGLVYAANEYAKMVAIDPKSGKQVWESTEKLPEVASPVYHKGLLYVATSYSILACFDATTGEQVWEHEFKAPFYSSPVVANGRLYLFDTSGNCYTVSPGRTFKLLGTSSLGEPVFATPAFVEGCMIVRGSKHVFAIGKKS